MRQGRLRRSGLLPLLLIVAVAIGGIAAVTATGSGPKLGLDLEGGYSVALQPVTETSEDILNQSIEIIRSRVDALGVAEPEITRQGDTIAVNLPGVSDRERAEELVGQTAELRFRPVLQVLPGSIEDLLEQQDTTTTTAAADDTTSTTSTTGTTDLTGSTVEGQAQAGAATPFQDDPETSTTTATSTPPLTTPPLTGFELTPREEDAADQPVVLAERDDDGDVVATYQLGPTAATGEIVADAAAELNGVQWGVRLEMHGGDAIDSFNAIAAVCASSSPECPTTQLAIVLDSQVVSAPQISQQSFTRDEIQITGQFTEGEAKDLALVLRFGALPVALEAQQSQEISATLGRDSLRAGVISGIIGLALVAVYMIAYYRLLGLVAILSLAVSAALLWTVVSWLGESQGLALTLAGMTGIIVSIGIAVDSNVVFYEHLKEDVVRGRMLRNAVSGSFASAFRVILKADIATLIGAVLLYWLTVGPVRGFALFLGMSTVLDIVASYFFMRPFVVKLARSRRWADRPGALGMPRFEGTP